MNSKLVADRLFQSEDFRAVGVLLTGDVAIDDRGERVSAEDHQAAPRPTFSNPIPQRPYTAPPHHCDYIPLESVGGYFA